MNRSALEIASTGLDDLYALQDAFSNVHAVFTLLLQHCPDDSAAHALAKLGVVETNSWSEKVLQWAECMDHELIDAEKAGGAQ